MSVVKIILILGLIYVAMNEKVEKTRNMLLIVTGLLAFCMFSVEGIQVIPSGTCTETATGADSVTADAAACAGVVDLDDSTACEAVKTAADDTVSACTYTEGGPPRNVMNNDLGDLFPGCTAGMKIKNPIPYTGSRCEAIPEPEPAPEPTITSFQGCAAGKKIKNPIPSTGAICEDIPEDDSWCSIM